MGQSASFVSSPTSSAPTFVFDTLLQRDVIQFEGGRSVNTNDPKSIMYISDCISGSAHGEIFVSLHPHTLGGTTLRFWQWNDVDSALFPSTNRTVFETFGTNAQKSIGVLNVTGTFAQIPYSASFISNPSMATGSASRNVLDTEWFVYHAYSSASNYGVRVNGYSQFTASSNTVSFNRKFPYIGTNITQTDFWAGKIFEMVIYNRTLNQTERRDITDYMLRSTNVQYSNSVYLAETQSVDLFNLVSFQRSIQALTSSFQTTSSFTSGSSGSTPPYVPTVGQLWPRGFY